MSDHHYVLMIGARGASLWLDTELARYPADPTGFTQLAREVQGQIISVLLDVVDEEFRREPLPGVSRKEAAGQLAERAARLFPNETRVACQRLVATEGQLCAMTQAGLLVPWIEALQAAGALLAGVFSVPMLGPAFMHRLRLARVPTLLVFATRLGGLRQLLVDEKGVRVSRLSVLQESPEAAGLQREIARFLRYLADTNAVTAAPAVRCLLPSTLHAGLAPYACQMLPAADALHADAALVALLREKRPTLDYARAAECAPFLAHRRRQRAWRSAVATWLLAASIAAGATLATRTLRAEAVRLSGESRALQAGIVATNAAASQALREEEVAEIERLTDPATSLPAALATLGAALESSPNLALESIRWQAARTLHAVLTLDGPREAIATEVESLAERLRAEPRVSAVALDKQAADPDASAMLESNSLAANVGASRTLTLQLRTADRDHD